MAPLSAFRRALHAATPALALGTAALTAALAACADSPTGPTPAPAATRVAATAASVTPSLAPAPTTAAPTWFTLSSAQLAALLADLAAFQAAVVPIPAPSAAPAPVAGSATPPAPSPAAVPAAAGTAMTCRAEHGWSATQTIGASGGTLHIGPHQFTVPAGALDHDVTITATSTGNTTRGLDFAPHGLRFHKPVSMTLSFAGCQVPEGSTLGVVYHDPTGQPVQRMPAHADHPSHKITALTDHFSGYLVAWNRGGN